MPNISAKTKIPNFKLNQPGIWNLKFEIVYP